MTTLPEIRAAVSQRCQEALSDCSWMAYLPGDTEIFNELIAPASSLMRGGKRTRACLLAAGYLCASSSTELPTHVVNAAAALEIYQASALVHDDVIDRAPTRRSQPSTHMLFRTVHEAGNWAGDSQHFGASAAILLGDLLLSLSHEMMASCENPEALLSFTRMTSEVAFGQYLDMRAENAGPSGDPIPAALSVLTHKSSRYSVVLPLIIGAQLGGASPALIEALESIGAPLGEAFQLRDDDLGVFGQERLTGKPVCGDIEEGKRTVLLALIFNSFDDTGRKRLSRMLGSSLSQEDAQWLLAHAEQSGARAKHEGMIAEREERAAAAWQELKSSSQAGAAGIDLLGQIIEELSQRVS